MNSKNPLQHSPSIRFEELNWVASSDLPRDQEQSHRLHEPDHLIGTIDPMTGRDIIDVTGHPSLVDGKLTIYFESEKTKEEFEQMPLNHPYEHDLGNLPADMERGG
jgi:YHS domain-containing protein